MRRGCIQKNLAAGIGFLLIFACDRAPDKAKKTESAVQSVTETAGTAEGKSYTGLYIIDGAPKSAECSNKKIELADVPVFRDVADCKQDQGSFSCRLASKTQTEIKGSIEASGQLKMGAQADLDIVKDLSLNHESSKKSTLITGAFQSSLFKGELQFADIDQKSRIKDGCSFVWNIAMSRIDFPDTEKPSSPTITVDSAKNYKVKFHWDSAKDNKTSEQNMQYYVFVAYRDKTIDPTKRAQASKTLVGKTSYEFTAPRNQKELAILVVAEDEAGNLSTYGNFVGVDLVTGRSVTSSGPEEDDILKELVNEPQVSFVEDDVLQSPNYQPKLDLNCHDYTPGTIEKCDRLATVYVENAGKFYLVRWNPKNLPVTFSLDSSADPVMWAEIVALYNKVAHENKTIPDNVDLLKIDPNARNTIRTRNKPEDPNTGGETFMRVAQETGEMLEAHIVLYPNNLRTFIRTYGKDLGLSRSYFKSAIKYIAMHEMGHALGMDHNHAGFKYSTVMASPPKIPEIPDDYYFPAGFGKDYDRVVLHYLYNDNFPRKGEPVYPFWVYRDPTPEGFGDT